MTGSPGWCLRWLIIGSCCMRLTRGQNLVLAHVPSDQVAQTVARMAGLGFLLSSRPPRGLSTACSGLPYCRYILAPSKLLLREIVLHLEQRLGPRAGTVSISVDACPHACAGHWIADIGMQGVLTHGQSGERYIA